MRRAITSVWKQKTPVKLLIVVDDGSTDDTESMVRDLSINSPISIHYEKKINGGVSSARNAGIALAKRLGDYSWLAFLDSDDAWLPQKNSLQLALIENHKHIRIVHGNERWYRSGKFLNQKKYHQKSGGFIYEKCLERCLISPSAVMMRADLIDELGSFREDYVVCEDYEIWLRITSQEEVGFVAEDVIEKYGGHEDQLSQKYSAMDAWRLKAMKEIAASGKLNLHQFEATQKEIAKKSKILESGFAKRNQKLDLNKLIHRQMPREL